ncbi:NAD(P)H-dependent oxidoreductase [Campylobacter sp. MIT 12-5580]|uniref:NAD(P)H-dependent oxidoreductase n=1 Tax=unclassified Campylobacter TaxID=2593542 RepID=UPI0010F4E55C|nr:MULTISPECIES: NAD(P)H-dependent oxidoreductase [unclassified Campylobacter]NDJ27387.1 NAD(P)H-dependent oxidoreductase [Campylobacter sp. MIT 19-121]TKX28511.1 NAD(P)H-dependent oxidoreductase [Campylobacter sp. MIT 12-5580]
MRFLDNEKIIEFSNFRHACNSNGFDGTKKLSEKDLNTLLEVARLSPSSFGFEPWKFLVIKDKALREKLEPIVWGGVDALKNASDFIIILARKNIDMKPDGEHVRHMMQDVQKLPDEIQKIKSEFYTNFQKNNFRIFGNEKAVFDWACKQCYIALGNVMSAAALLGLDSLAIEGFDQEGVEKLLADEKLIDSTHFGVAVCLALGYRANPPKRAKTRQDFEAVVQFI